jgi:hypothetical protein
MIITCFDEDEVVEQISEITGIDFLKVSDGEKAGGPKVLSLESYGACYRCVGREKIDEIIETFKKADFDFPELAVLVIDDDNDVYNGSILRES